MRVIRQGRVILGDAVLNEFVRSLRLSCSVRPLGCKGAWRRKNRSAAAGLEGRIFFWLAQAKNFLRASGG